MLQYTQDNEEIISHIFRLDPITAGSILLTDTCCTEKGNPGPVLIVKIIEGRNALIILV